MPKRVEDPIRVPTGVLDELETVREASEANMLDYHVVQAVASRLDYPKPVLWLKAHIGLVATSFVHKGLRPAAVGKRDIPGGAREDNH